MSIFKTILKTLHYIIWTTLIIMWAFTDMIDEMSTNDLIMVCTVILIETLDKND